MAMRPRTNEDRNRLAAHRAAQPMVPYPTGGSEAQPELPNTMEYATEADAASLGVTVDDIRRMMSNPGRYGGIYKPKGNVPAEVSHQPAVDNPKRTAVRQKADGTQRVAMGGYTPPAPQRDVPEMAQQSIWDAILGAGTAWGAKAIRAATEKLAAAKEGIGERVEQARKALPAPPIEDAEYTEVDPAKQLTDQSQRTPLIEAPPERALIGSDAPTSDNIDDLVKRSITMDSPAELGPAPVERAPVVETPPAPVALEGGKPISPENEEIARRVAKAIGVASRPKVKGKRF